MEKSFKILVINLLLTSTLPIWATSKFEYDNNSDGLIDNIFIYEAGVLISHKNDRNYDGKFDYILTRKDATTTITFDSNFDGIFDRYNTFESLAQTRLVKKYINDSLYASYEDNLIQEAEQNSSEAPPVYEDLQCLSVKLDKSISSVDQLLENFTPVLNKLSQGFTGLIPGVQIHESCFENFSKKSFSKLTENALKKGLSCLNDLAKKDQSKALKSEIPNLLNFFDAQLSGKKKDISILCHEKQYDWDPSTIAHASTDITSPKGLKEISHPYVSINPKIHTGLFGAIIDGPSSKDEMEGIIFHEMIHNFGYVHGSGIDITYGCETCCFSDDKLAKKSGCNLCAGTYKSDLDPKYIRDLSIYTNESKLVAGEIFYYRNLLAIDKSQENLDSLFITLGPRGLGVQGALLKEAKKRGLSLTLSEKNQLKEIENAQDYYISDKEVLKSNELFTSALLTLYFDKDIEKATSLLAQIDMKSLNQISSNFSNRSNADAGKVKRGLSLLAQSLEGKAQNSKTKTILRRFY